MPSFAFEVFSPLFEGFLSAVASVGLDSAEGFFSEVLSLAEFVLFELLSVFLFSVSLLPIYSSLVAAELFLTASVVLGS